MTELTEVAREDEPDAGDVLRGEQSLTWRQRKILLTIRDSVRTRGYPPSMREVADAVGLVSMASVRYQLDVLERAGYLKRESGRPRAIELRLPAKAPPELVQGRLVGEPALVPVVARIGPGIPVLEERQIDDIWPLPRQVTGNGTLFIVQVPDEAMAGAAIAPRDWVVVRKQDDAADGEIVVAMLADVAAIRTLRRRDGHAWLIPHHRDYQPVLADEAVILGVVASVLRLV